MRVLSALLLTAVCFASIDAAKTFEDSAIKDVALVREVSSDVPVMGFLRKLKVATTDDEERGNQFFNLGFLDDIVHGAVNFKTNLDMKWEFQKMLKEGVTASDAFTKLNVNKAADNLLETTEWKKWAAFVAHRDPNELYEDLAWTMMIKLKTDNMLKVLAKAAKNPITKDVAEKIEDAQVKYWVGLPNQPVDILKKLMLNKDGMFDSPEFVTFTKYLKAYNARYNKETNVIAVFEEGYGKAAFVKLLASGKNIENPVATKMLDEVLEEWLDFTKSPYSLFTAMGLDKAGAGLFTNPMLSKWVNYMHQFNKKLPSTQTTMIETFLKSYGDETLTTMINAAKKVPETKDLATNLEIAKDKLFKTWMTEGITPDDLLLKLDSTTLDKNPNANIWRAYYNAYDKANPGKLFSFNP